MTLLVINAGSSSVKLVAFDAQLAELGRAMVERIGSGGPVDHGTALVEGLQSLGLPLSDLQAVAHRVVHGGARREAGRVTPALIAEIKSCIPLAPLHNPVNLTGIEAMARLTPDLPQYVSFDTAFHATNPEVAVSYALPLVERQKGLRRYGFHGLSYAAMVHRLREEGHLPSRLLAFHMGNGVSASAIVDGQSIANTMGYSPLEGLTMGTRAGSLDPGVVLALVAEHGVDRASQILNRESGLLGLAGASDMRELQARHDPQARFVIEHFCYWAIRHGGSLIAAMGGLDAIAFTGGIGENDQNIRARILAGLEFIARDVSVFVIPAEEERQIAREALCLMGQNR